MMAGAPEKNQNRLVHAAYSKLRPAQRSRFAELTEQAGSREGLVEILTERAVKAVEICELVESYVVEQRSKGVDLESMPVLGKLPSFQNSAQRLISTLLAALPKERDDDSDVINLLAKYKEGNKDDAASDH